jgi:DNA-directed RNA polymerase specialized sigma24 family protein
MVAAGQSYRQIARELGIDKGTVMAAVKRARAAA